MGWESGFPELDSGQDSVRIFQLVGFGMGRDQVGTGRDRPDAQPYPEHLKSFHPLLFNKATPFSPPMFEINTHIGHQYVYHPKKTHFPCVS